jgi:pyrroline-5-carboxylate reductase
MSSVFAGERVAFIGGGVMGEAIIRGLLNGGLVAPDQIVVSDPVEARREYLVGSLSVSVTARNEEAASQASVVVFAVKPQVLDKVLKGLKDHVRPQSLVVSIVAGARIAAYVQGLGTPAVVRVMPNTPGQVGQGASLWTATAATGEAQRAQAKALVSALGVEVYSDKEDDVDMATALSGSGPAYVFLFVEALIDAGVRVGLAHDVAATLALQTVLGSAVYARETGEHPAILRNRVTSPGGTTAAALHEMEKGGLRATIAQAVMAAYQRARELGDLT